MPEDTIDGTPFDNLEKPSKLFPVSTQCPRTGENKGSRLSRTERSGEQN